MRRPLFQIHLSTAVVLMFVAGLLLWANLQGRPSTWEDYRGWPVCACDDSYITLDSEEACVLVALAQKQWPQRLFVNFMCCGAILITVAFLLEYLTRKPRPGLIPTSATVALVLSAAAILLWVNWRRFHFPWLWLPPIGALETAGWPFWFFCDSPLTPLRPKWRIGSLLWDIPIWLCILISVAVVSETVLRWRAARRA